MAEIDFDIPGPIGIQDIDVRQSFTKLNTNRTLMVACLNLEGPYEPEVVPDEATGSITKLFSYAKPNVDVELETGNEDDPSQELNVQFDNLSAFQPQAISKRIPLLQKLQAQEDSIKDILKAFENSEKLKKIAKDPDQKAALLDIIKTIKAELTGESDEEEE
jgi:hypothetical protein